MFLWKWLLIVSILTLSHLGWSDSTEENKESDIMQEINKHWPRIKDEIKETVQDVGQAAQQKSKEYYKKMKDKARKKVRAELED